MITCVLVGIGVSGEQQLHDVIMAFGASDVQRRLVLVVWPVDIGIGREQQLDDIAMATAACYEQRRSLVVVVSLLQVGARGE